MCPRKEERGQRKEVEREVEEEEERVARVVEKEVKMMQQARVKLKRNSQLKVENWLKAILVVAAAARELGRKRRTRRRITKTKTEKVEEGASRSLKIRSPTSRTEMTLSQRPTKRTAKRH